MKNRLSNPERGGVLAVVFVAGVLVGVGVAAAFLSVRGTLDPGGAAAEPFSGKATADAASRGTTDAEWRRRIASLERRISYLESANSELLQRLQDAEGAGGSATERRSSGGSASPRSSGASRSPATPADTRGPDGTQVPDSPPEPLVLPDLSLSEETAEGKYTEYERRALERILAETRERLDEVESGRVRRVRRQSDKVVLQVDSFYDEGEKLAREFRDAVVLLLGEDRAQDFLEIMAPRVRSHLSGFGSLPRQVSISKLESGGYLIGIRTESPDGTEGSTVPREYRSHMVQELPRLYREYFQP